MVSLYTYNESFMTDCEFKLTRYEISDPAVTSVVISLYLTTSLLAFAGNLVVIIVESFGKLTNANFRKFLINLAVVDILTSVLCVPFSYSMYIYMRWIFPHFLCPVVQFVQYISVFVNTLTLTLISIERYLAVNFPFNHRNIIYRNCNKVLALIWTTGCLYAFYGSKDVRVIPFTPPRLYNESKTNYPMINETWYTCLPVRTTTLNLHSYAIINYVLTFALPLIIISLCYFFIIRKLLLNRARERDQPLRRSGNSGDTTKIIQMMLVVVALFTICWAPIKTYQILRTFFRDSFRICSWYSYDRHIVLYSLFHFLTMAHSFVNPIIYSFMSRSFRMDLKDLTRNLSVKIGRTRSITKSTEINGC